VPTFKASVARVSELLHAGKRGPALEELRAALVFYDPAQPEHLETLFMLGALLLEENRGEAEAVFLRATALSPPVTPRGRRLRAACLYLLGTIARAQGQTAIAESRLREAATALEREAAGKPELSPLEVRVLNEIGAMQLAARSLVAARASFERAAMVGGLRGVLRGVPDGAPFLLDAVPSVLGAAYVRSEAGDGKGALAVLRTLSDQLGHEHAMDPVRVPVWIDLAGVLAASADLAGAEKALRKALELVQALDSEDLLIDVLERLGAVLLYSPSPRVPEAVGHFRRALALCSAQHGGAEAVSAGLTLHLAFAHLVERRTDLGSDLAKQACSILERMPEDARSPAARLVRQAARAPSPQALQAAARSLCAALEQSRGARVVASPPASFASVRSLVPDH
jgi:tetratricopeptide (TPR) repeat protein